MSHVNWRIKPAEHQNALDEILPHFWNRAPWPLWDQPAVAQAVAQNLVSPIIRA